MQFMPIRPTLRHSGLILLLGAVFVLIWWVVYRSGGTAFVHVHLIYVPIILCGFIYGVSGGIAAGILGSILMGPLMPFDVGAGIEQSPLNWMVRGVYLVTFGGLIGSIQGVIKNRDQRLFEVLNVDPTTGLFRTSAFIAHLGPVFAAREPSQKDALIQLVVKNFDELVLAFGLEAYGRTLQRAARRLQQDFGGSAILGQMGRDRLNLFIQDCDRRQATARAARAIHTIQSSLGDEAISLVLDLEAGIAIAPSDGQTPEDLVLAASAALADPGENGGLIRSFDRASNDRRKENLELLADLKRALAFQELEFYAQPKMKCADLSCCGAELLVRWNHLEKGFISPAHFIPLAERSHLRGIITDHALAAAHDYISDFTDYGWSEGCRVCINLSGEDLTDTALGAKLERLFADAPEFLKRLELEITETALVRDRRSAVPILESLSDLGATIAIDDFGTGYSSLAYLRDIPANVIKLDRIFIRYVTVSRRNQSIVRHTIAMAKDFGLVCVAEGVEDQKTFDWLRENGCDIIQGYWYARPMPRGAVSGWLADQIPHSHLPPADRI